jgi:superfamily II DNA/RNA helicase
MSNNKNSNEVNNKDDVPSKSKFEDMGLKVNLLRGIYGYGYESPSNIQSKATPYIIARKDLVAQSQSGTGKTASFGIGTLQVIDETKDYPQAIIMAPTRELSMQIQSVITDIGKFQGIKTVLAVGGISVNKNVSDCARSHIIIGTPGRILDLMDRKAFKTSEISILVMDEADELLNRDFLKQTQSVITALPNSAQICIYSATLAKPALELTEKFMSNPDYLLVEEEKLTLDLIAQFNIYVDVETNKLDTLYDLYGQFSIGQCIIYVNGQKKAEWLKDKLSKENHSVEAIHGGMKPHERTEVMKVFRSGTCRVLVCTDLLARGIDVQQVGYVINYDVPENVASYLHRIGRSGRYGKRGIAVNFVTRRDNYNIRALEDYYRIRIEGMPDPKLVNEYLVSGKME